MNTITRLAWYAGNWVAQIIFACRVGYRDGSGLRPGARPSPFKESQE